MSTEQLSTTEENKRTMAFMMRLVLGIFLSGLCIFQLFMTFRGLDNAAAMDQAQIARQIARGEGFTTKSFSPYEILHLQKVATREAKKLNAKNQNGDTQAAIDFNAIPNTTYGPLHPLMLATAIKLTGYDNFDDNRMGDIEMVYSGDRVIASVSTIFFLIALVLSFHLFRKLFDEVLACTVVAFLGLSELMLNFAISGLAQPMMMCFMLGIALCISSAINAQHLDQTKKVYVYTGLSYILAILLCLTANINICCAIGLLIFCGLYFYPKGLHAMIGFIVITMCVLVPIVLTQSSIGGLGVALERAVYGGISSETGSYLLRTADDFGVTFNIKNFFLFLFGSTLAQVDTMYINMGSIITTPFFLLALFNRYKKPAVEGLKWLIFSCWICAAAGMALFGEVSPMSVGQLSSLFAPFFAAYGVSLVFIFIARLQLADQFSTVRGLAIVIMILISSGQFLISFPQELYRGIWLSARGIPHFPPYYPNKLNGDLHNWTNESDLIVTDQPWAVAWYADRKALWLPRSIAQYTDNLEPIFARAKQNVQGFLITPSSHSMQKRGITGIISDSGDFAPLALEGKLLQLAPKHNMAFAELFNNHGTRQSNARTLASLVSSQGEFPHRNFLLGAEMVYYSRNQIQK